MMKGYVIVFMLLMLLNFSCQFLEKSKALSGTHEKYWDIIYMRDTKYEVPAYCYGFNNKGDCKYYYYDRVQGTTKRIVFNYDDIDVSGRWEFVNDSIIKINDEDFIIRVLNENIIVIVSLKNSDSVVLIPSQ